MEKITVTELMNKLGYRICGGMKLSSQCYGKNARLMMFGDDSNLLFAECVFDTVNKQVYEVRYLQGKDERGENLQYIWRHPDYKVAYRKEAALLRETKGWTAPPHKQISLDSVLESISKHAKG